MSDTLLNILAGTLPQDCYPNSADDFQKQILSLARAVLPSAAYAIGDTAPSDHDIPWIRTDASNNFIRLYTWGGYGNWVSPHPIPAADSRRILWVGIESDLVTLDEGTSDPVTDTTGPFWVVDHAIDGRFLLGPGAFPSGTTIAVGGTGGEEKHVLTPDELAPHTHKISILKAKAESGSGQLCLQDPSQPDVVGTQAATPFSTDQGGRYRNTTGSSGA